MSHRFNGSVRSSFVCRECLAINVIEIVDKEEREDHLRDRHVIFSSDPKLHFIPYTAFHESFQNCEERRLVAFAEEVNKLCKQAA